MSDYEIVEHNGKEVRKYPDGSLRNEHGAIVKISPERARLMQQRRRISGIIQAGKAIQEATDSETVDEGVKKILKARVDVALNDKGRAGNDAAKLVLLASQHLQNEKKVDVGGEVKHTAGIEMDEETVRFLEKLAQSRREMDNRPEPEIIDGKFTD